MSNQTERQGRFVFAAKAAAAQARAFWPFWDGHSLTYALADFLYGPVRAACPVMAVYALTARVGERAPRQMSLALLVAVLAAGMFVTAALPMSSTTRESS